ncbi:hypothetical protein BBJ29_009388, partial [Phytophthora kernoviae]
KVGLQSSDLIIAVDFTESNLWKGKQTFEGRSLHYIDRTGRVRNPYQTVISAITRVFELFDDDDAIPAYGFGGHPERALSDRYFPFVEGRGCELDEVLQRYFEIASTMELSATASFVPVIHQAVKVAKKTRRYHILIIISNGHIDDPAMARQAIVEASEYPISIVMVGVGDGPWGMMREFDDQLPERQFDNFQFVNYNTVPRGNLDNPDGGFAMQALMEIPAKAKQHSYQLDRHEALLRDSQQIDHFQICLIQSTSPTPSTTLATMFAAPRTVNTYAAYEKAGELKPWQYTTRHLGDEDVEIKISHCGICGSDIHTMDSGWGPTQYPVVVGHEIVGEVTAAGPKVTNMAVGDRVGVGAQVWACRNKDADKPCDDCADKVESYCNRAVLTYNAKYEDGENAYGGYADYVRVSSAFAFKIPENIPSDVAAPLLCAGATVFSPLKHENVKAGDRVGVIGIGGLGHLAIQFIRALGAVPVAFSRSANKRQQILDLGAAEFYNLSDPEDAKKAASSVHTLILTADAKDMPYNQYLGLLRKRGTLVMLGIPNDEIKFLPMFVVGRGIRVVGSLIGSIEDIEDMLKLASEKNVRPIIQKLPMAKVNEGITIMREGRARYRVVLEN